MLIYRHLVIMAYSEKLSDTIVLNVNFIPQKSQYSFCISINLSQKRVITQSKVENDIQIWTWPVFYVA